MATISRTKRATPSYRLRNSTIHGKGLFATRPIRKGARIIEYVGQHIDNAEADRRFEKKKVNDGHTFFFTLDEDTVIDAGVRGNVARFINHSCAPNCEPLIEDGKIWIYAIRSIATGAELAYDYNIQRAPEDPANIAKVYACRCGAPRCRGTMLAKPKKKRVKKTKLPKKKAKKAT